MSNQTLRSKAWRALQGVGAASVAGGLIAAVCLSIKAIIYGPLHRSSLLDTLKAVAFDWLIAKKAIDAPPWLGALLGGLVGFVLFLPFANETEVRDGEISWFAWASLPLYGLVVGWTFLAAANRPASGDELHAEQKQP